MSYYSYGALGTDRYPPFRLGREPGYPARRDIAHPERLSRSQVLVKWRLLAVQHYLVIAFFTGGVRAGWWSGGLVSIRTLRTIRTLLTLIAGFAVAFTDRYPRDLFALIVGLNRWVLRVAAYASLRTDAYPPFRLYQGGREPAVGAGR